MITLLPCARLYDATGGTKGAFVVASNSSFGIGQYGANPLIRPFGVPCTIRWVR
jgi:hypothetical protein